MLSKLSVLSKPIVSEVATAVFVDGVASVTLLNVVAVFVWVFDVLLSVEEVCIDVVEET